MSAIGFIKQIKKLEKKENICIILILIFAFILNFYPHINYPYFFHVDEWYHVAIAKQITLNSEIDWYFGTNFSIGIEGAWHTMLSFIYSIYKLSIPQWIFLPTIFFIIAIIIIYFFVSKLYGKKEALISSFLVALTPTDITIGGPVFLIPLNLSLIFIPLALIFAFKLTRLKDHYNYIILFIITSFLLYSHPPTAVVLIIILGFYFLLNLIAKNTKCKKHALTLFFVLLFSLLISIPNYLNDLQSEGFESISFDFPIFPDKIIFLFGIIPTFFFVVGFYFKSKSKEKETWSIFYTCLFLLLIIVIFSLFEVNYLLPHQRAYIPLFLFMSIIAAIGYLKILDFKKYIGKYSVLILVIFLATSGLLGINRNMETNYYRIIDDYDYENFIWIKENTESDSIVISDPIIARALVPVAERRVYAVMPFGPTEEQMDLVMEANRFLNENCSNTSFLIENNINIIYTKNSCENANLIELREDIYIFKNLYLYK
jgi:4-amino-4-deoxy-L-arabinose transferase-like glycosyltransferase